MPTHKCPAPDCTVQVGRIQLMCPGHWKMVPKPLQRELYAAYDHGRGWRTERHKKAMMAAIEAVTP